MYYLTLYRKCLLSCVVYLSSDSQSRAIVVPKKTSGHVQRHIICLDLGLLLPAWWEEATDATKHPTMHKATFHTKELLIRPKMSVVLRLTNMAIPSPLSNEIYIIPLYNFMKCIILILWDWLNIWHFSICYTSELNIDNNFQNVYFSLQAICFILLHFENIICKIDHLKMCIKIDD